MHEAKVPDFLKASGQDMLQEATDETPRPLLASVDSEAAYWA